MILPGCNFHPRWQNLRLDKTFVLIEGRLASYNPIQVVVCSEFL